LAPPVTWIAVAWISTARTVQHCDGAVDV